MAATARNALYERLHSDPTLQGLLGAPDALFHQVAPAGTPTPYVILAKQTGNPDWQFAGAHIQYERWLVKAVAAGGSASPAEAAADRIDELLNDAPLSIDSMRLLFCRRVSDVDYAETSGPDLYHHVGAIYRVDTTPA